MEHQKAIMFSLLTFLLALSAQGQINFWEQTNGPWYMTPYDEPIQTSMLASDSSLFLGTFSDGVFCSTDGGISWTQMNSGLTSLRVVAIATNSNGHLFLGTNDKGVFRSTDNGVYWSTANDGINNLNVTSLTVSHSAIFSDYIFVGTNGSGVFRSTNGGATWSQINDSLINLNVTALVVSSSGPSSGLVFVGDQACNIFRSTNAGLNWNKVLAYDPGTHVRSFFVNPLGYIFAGTGNNPFYAEEGTILRSTNNGTTWENTFSDGAGCFTMTANGFLYAGVGGGYVKGNCGVLCSTDNGAHWIFSHPSLYTDYPTTFVTNAEDYIYSGLADGQVTYSSDNGSTWNRAGIRSTVRSLTIEMNGDVFAATQSFGIYRSTDLGGTWVATNTGIVNQNIFSLTANPPGDLFAGSGGGLYHSTDHGNNWVSIGLADKQITAFATNPVGQMFCGTSDSGMYRSTDGGKTWGAVDNGITNLHITSICITADGHIFAGSLGSGVFRSVSNGNSWTQASFGLMDSTVCALELDSSNHCMYAGTSTGIYRSIDNSNNWTQQGLVWGRVVSIEAYTSGVVFAAVQNYGVYRSTNQGDSWTIENSGLTNKSILSLKVAPTGFLYAGSAGSGIFRSSQSTSSVIPIELELPRSCRLDQNYPNPFNPSTTIRYGLPQKSQVTLKVYNTLGQLVATLVNGEQDAGYHEVRFDGVNLASGVYFYRLQAGTYVETRKLLLLR